MLSEESRLVIEKARNFYDAELRNKLESGHLGRFVCIEPISQDYYLGDSFDEAVNAALDAHPDRLTHTLRIGHSSAFHLGVSIS